MGLLACDVTGNGVVMSADSQDVVLAEGRVETVGKGGHHRKDKVIRLATEQFSALVGYVGTEEIGGMSARAWLERFVERHRDASGFDKFCTELGRALTASWEENELDTCLWVFISGYDRSGDGPYFWYVVNASGFDPPLAVSLTRHRIAPEPPHRVVEGLVDEELVSRAELDSRLREQGRVDVSAGELVDRLRAGIGGDDQAFCQHLDRIADEHERGRTKLERMISLPVVIGPGSALHPLVRLGLETRADKVGRAAYPVGLVQPRARLAFDHRDPRANILGLGHRLAVESVGSATGPISSSGTPTSRSIAAFSGSRGRSRRYGP